MGLAFLTSVFLILALPPYDQWWLVWVSLVPLLMALPGTSPREALLIGAFSGTCTSYMAFHWILELMEKFSKLGPAAYLVMLAMAMYQCLSWALWCYFLRAPGPPNPGPARTLGGLILAAASWTALEFFFPIIFPWYLANTQHTRPETNSVIALGGVSLLTFAIVLVNLCLARLLTRGLDAERGALWPTSERRPVFLVSTMLATLVFVVGYHLAVKGEVERALADAPKMAVGLVQPNEWIGEGRPDEGLHAYQRLTLELVEECKAKGESLDLVLWPESAVRVPPPTVQRRPAGASEPVTLFPGGHRYPLDASLVLPSSTAPAVTFDPNDSLDDLLAVQRGHNVPILFGTTTEDMAPDAKGPIEGRPPLYNCGMLVDTDGAVLGVVKKVKLLMFGETIPGSGIYPDIYKLLPNASCLLSGDEAEIIQMGDRRLGIMICYEDLLPWFHYQLAQKKPQILLNLTNDAWFGRTEEPICHMDLATLRAVEGRCYLVRSTPTGVSCVVDPWGQLVASIPSDKVGTLRHEVSLLDITTPWERFGDTVAWTSLLYLLVFGGLWWSDGRKAAWAARV